MKSMKKFIALATAVALLSSSAVQAQDDAGVAYYDSYGTTGLTPAIAVGVIATVAVIAVLVNSNKQGLAHSHTHCSGAQ